MNRAHEEDALSRRLEGDDLDDDGKRLGNEDDADDGEQNFRMRENGRLSNAPQ